MPFDQVIDRWCDANGLQRSNRGRPRKQQPQAGERVSIGLRVTPDMKAAIDQAVAASGRSQSQEVELRLERSFEEDALKAEVARLRLAIDLLLDRLAALTTGQSVI